MAGAVLGIDLGTTEVKAGLFTLDGEQLALARQPYPMLVGEAGAAEQDPQQWWSAIVEAVGALGPERRRAVAICTVGQGPTLVVVDELGKPIRPAITWLDRRPAAGAAGAGTEAPGAARRAAGGEVAGLEVPVAEAEGPETVDGTAGFGLAATIAWLGRHDPAAVSRARWLLTAWDWVGLRLSGVAATSRQREDAAAAPSADTAKLPPDIAVGQSIGRLLPAVAADLGLRTGLPIIAGVNDGTATILGAGLRRAGQAVDTGGASGGFAVYSDRPLDLAGTFCAPAPLPGLWVLGGAMAATGASLDWLAADVLGGRWRIDELIAEAEATPPGAGGLVFLPYLAGERSPIWDDAARGVFAGLSLAHGRGHLVRAILEASAMAVRHVAAPIREAGVAVTELWLAGRPATSPTWAQIKSDVVGVRVGIPRVTESSVLGAAMLAAVGAGLVAGLGQAVERMSGEARWVTPRAATGPTYDRIFEVYRSLYPNLKPVLHELAAIGRAGVD